MRRMITLGGVSAVTAVLVPLAAYYLNPPVSDPLGEILRGYGFVPIKPPSTLIDPGSLYYVDAKGSDFKAICHAEKAELDDAVIESRSWAMQDDLERHGAFATDITVDFGALIKGSVDNSYVQKVHSSLTDVFLEEIPLGRNWLIFAKLMKKPECNKVATQIINAGGYVCQGQKILHATVEYKIDRDTQNKLGSQTEITPDKIKDVVKTAIKTQSEQSVVERSGGLFSGSALNYGVSMNPTCLAPPDGHFERILPRTMFDRLVNFVLFRIVEPILSARSEKVEVVQNTHFEE